MIEKFCKGCDKTKPIEEFYLRKNDKTPYSRCKICSLEQLHRYRLDNPEKVKEYHRNHAKKWRKNNPEAHKNIALKTQYGITLDDYNKMVEAQNGVCLICGETPSSKSHKTSPNYKKSNGKVLHIDHDHKTGKVRGLLCRTCNLLLGYANDDPEFLQRAIDYLKMH